MRTMFDYVVIDGGQNLGEMTKAIMKLADRVIVVTLLNLTLSYQCETAPGNIPASSGTRRTTVSLSLPTGPTGNRATYQSRMRSGPSRKRLPGPSPNDFQNTMNAINMGRTLNDIAPGSEINKKIGEIAVFFRGQQGPGRKQKKKGLFGSFV